MSVKELSPWWLHDAARNGDISEVRELLDAGVPVDYDYGLYGTALHEAAAIWGGKDHTEIVTLLLDRGADMNGSGYDGMTPLHYAVHRLPLAAGNLEFVTLLLDRGADVNARDDNGCTPLHRVDFAERPDVVALLASRGAAFTDQEKEALAFSLAEAEDRLAEAAAEVETIRSALALASR